MNKNVYEIGLLINPDLSQQEAEQTVEKIKDFLTKNSASVISQGEIVNIELAYQIITKIASKNARFDEAHFTWVKFESETLAIDLIKKEVDKIKKEVFRYLITKTVSDNEVTDKFNSKDEESEDDLKIEVEDIEDGNTETKSTPKTVKEEKVVTKTSEKDDLKKIEGIGPKIESVLNEAGINTFAELASSKDEDTQELIKEVKGNHQAGTWNEQAELARDGKWDELKTLQDVLDGGVEKKED